MATIYTNELELNGVKVKILDAAPGVLRFTKYNNATGKYTLDPAYVTALNVLHSAPDHPIVPQEVCPNAFDLTAKYSTRPLIGFKEDGTLNAYWYEDILNPALNPTNMYQRCAAVDAFPEGYDGKSLARYTLDVLYSKYIPCALDYANTILPSF